MNTSTTAINASGASIKLTKVAADYKLQSGEVFLAQGRVNKKFPARPYYHYTRTASDLAATLPSDLSTCRTAIAKLWSIAAIDLLKDKSASLTPGASITLNLTTTDLLLYIADIGLNKREAISGEELDEFCSTDTFMALAEVHSWSPVAIAKVSAALRQYAAPAHRKSPADATVLSIRLADMLSLLTGEDAEQDAQTTTIHTWLMTKLLRDKEQLTVNLVDSI